MTDRESLEAMLDRAGVVWVEMSSDTATGIEVPALQGPHNHGYRGFVASFSFREDGSLESVGVWE